MHKRISVKRGKGVNEGGCFKRSNCFNHEKSKIKDRVLPQLSRRVVHKNKRVSVRRKAVDFVRRLRRVSDWIPTASFPGGRRKILRIEVETLIQVFDLVTPFRFLSANCHENTMSVLLQKRSYSY